MALRSRLVLVFLVLSLVPSWGCGSGGASGGGGGGGGSSVTPPGTTPEVDVALRGDDGALPRIHIYRDVLNGPTSGAAPDVRIASPPSIERMAFNGSHLVLGADYGVPGNSILVYTPTDLAQAVPLPSATIVLPPPPGVTAARIHMVLLHAGDVYVFSTFSAGSNPTTVTAITHVYRDVSALTSASTPDVFITHDIVQIFGISASVTHLSIAQGVLWVTTFGRVYRNLGPESLVGLVAPDRTLDVALDLGILERVRLVVGGGDAYFINVQVHAFADAANLAAGQQRLFVLDGPSGTVALPDRFLRLRGRLFSLGFYPISPFAIVGHDVAGPVLDYAPPDIMLGPPVVGEQLLDGAADTLFAASVTQGIVAIYRSASALEDEAKPDLYLWDPDIIQAEELRVAER